MKLVLLVVGKTEEAWVNQALAYSGSRLQHYLPFEDVVLPDVKSANHLTEQQIRQKEGVAILSWCKASDMVVLLDERGTQMTSEGLANWMQKKMNAGLRQLVMVVGGAYGFDEAVYKAFPEKISLSSMTLSHQMVRVVLVEQVYRAMTILKGEPYHHG
jgi:23S rRNA (pseudouridine1915-N3)-methyltransferase